MAATVRHVEIIGQIILRMHMRGHPGLQRAYLGSLTSMVDVAPKAVRI